MVRIFVQHQLQYITNTLILNKMGLKFGKANIWIFRLKLNFVALESLKSPALVLHTPIALKIITLDMVMTVSTI